MLCLGIGFFLPSQWQAQRKNNNLHLPTKKDKNFPVLCPVSSPPKIKGNTPQGRKENNTKQKPKPLLVIKVFAILNVVSGSCNCFSLLSKTSY